jgi:N-acetylglutamate synthase-like GNAT family acetyltransferase
VSAIRKATKDDLRAVRQWLEREEAQDVHGNFLCNWEVIDAAHRREEVLVYIDDCGAPAGYLTGYLGRDTILQVRNDVRGCGVGTQLVKACVESIEKSGEPNGLTFVQCAPEDSRTFWAKMGFAVLEGAGAGGSIYAYRVIRQERPLTGNGREARVVVVTYPEHWDWKPETPPERTDQPAARLRPDGIVDLGERVYILGRFPNHTAQDAVVQIVVDGNAIYCDKAKRVLAAKFGVRPCPNGYYLDAIDTFGLGRTSGN